MDSETQRPSGVSAESAIGTFQMSPAMVERSAGRLFWIAFACAFTAIYSVTIHRFLQPEMREAQEQPVAALTLVIVFLFSVSILAVQRFHLVPDVYILRAGLVFEVLISWSLSYTETALPMRPEEVVRGTSMVAVWLMVVSLLIRQPLGAALVAALLSGLTWPVAYLLNIYLIGSAPLPTSRLAVWLSPIAATVFWAYFLNRRMFRIELEAQRAEELGSYELVQRIGQGGMGDVWRARHRLIARDAAIKIIRPELMATNSARQAELLRRRFEREAKVTASLHCPHTIYLFDFGRAANGLFYYVMELLSGVSLQKLVDRFGPLPAGRAVYLLKQICLSLEEAHRNGMVHRDVKPSNIFICQVGVQYDFVKVLDFGLVKRLDSGDSALLTQDGTAVGTPAYMAPEAALGQSVVDGRLDIYSLGCVAYFMLTGQVVFDEPSATAMALAHVQKEVIPPSRRSELPVPECVERVLLQCLEKDPARRPRSALEIAEALDAGECGAPWSAARAEEWWLSHLPAGAAELHPVDEAKASPVRVF